MTVVKRGDEQAAHELCVILSELNFVGQQQRKHRLVTPGSFARPNFRLVCELLVWLLNILEPSEETLDIEKLRCDKYRPNDVPEPRHVDFIKNCVRRIHKLLDLRLDPLLLYRADESSCAELLKVATIVFEAAQLVVNKRLKLLKDIDCSEREVTASKLRLKELEEHLSQVDNLEGQCQKLVQLSGELERLLSDEDRNQRERVRATDARLPDGPELAKVVKESQVCLEETSAKLRAQNEELQLDLSRLAGRLELKGQEVDEATRQTNEQLLRQAPGYLEKQANLRQQYDLAYDQYVSSYRTLAHLKECLYAGQPDENDDDSDLDDNDALRDGDREQKDVTGRMLAGGNNLYALGTAQKAPFKRPLDKFLEPDGPRPDDASNGSDNAEDDDDESELLVIGDATTGPARLLESLFEAAGMSNPMSASFTTAGPSAPEEVGRGRLVVETAGASVGAATATGLARTMPSGLRALGREEAGLELEGLLDEFGAFGASANDEASLGAHEPEELDDEEDDDDEDDGDEEEEEEDGLNSESRDG